jgi:hypothetical protein
MRARWWIAAAVVGGAVGIMLLRAHPSSLGSRGEGRTASAPYQIAAQEEVAKAIKEAVSRPRPPSRCEEGPPSAAEQVAWREDVQPRELARVPLARLVKQSDGELTSEVWSRLLDKHYGVGITGMSRAEQNAYLALALEDDVMNDGFEGFFANSTGNCARRTLTALTEIGHREMLRIYTAALATFPGSAPSEDRLERNIQMEAAPHGAKLRQALDELYIEVAAEAPLARYIRAHVANLALPP